MYRIFIIIEQCRSLVYITIYLFYCIWSLRFEPFKQDCTNAFQWLVCGPTLSSKLDILVWYSGSGLLSPVYCPEIIRQKHAPPLELGAYDTTFANSALELFFHSISYNASTYTYVTIFFKVLHHNHYMLWLVPLSESHPTQGQLSFSECRLVINLYKYVEN